MKFSDYFRRSQQLLPLEKPAEHCARIFRFLEIYHKEETDKSEADRQKDRLWIVYAWMMCSEAGRTPYAVVLGVRRAFPEIAENGKEEMKVRKIEDRDASLVRESAFQEAPFSGRQKVSDTTEVVFNLALTWNHNMYAENVLNKGIRRNGKGTK
ncbi:hypothetical protein NGC38_23475 [Kluyvera cryocrescens]|uniref:hypothetical protein n=1 Tax=Kluyvera cryocrescens TaxID=580 RepID=UPI002DBCD5CB|nr:hypothetical protein [Kluyvera cryocrescens]MEB7559466.1 hypothetical protein [Kluyvera cryocrescens]